MKLLHHQRLAALAAQVRQLQQPAGFRYRLKGILAPFQDWADAVARRSRRRH